MRQKIFQTLYFMSGNSRQQSRIFGVRTLCLEFYLIPVSRSFGVQEQLHTPIPLCGNIGGARLSHSIHIGINTYSKTIREREQPLGERG